MVTIIGSVTIAIIAGFVPLMHIVELSNTGVLAVFLLNFISLWHMRRKHPEVPRKFHCPCLPVVAVVGVIVCGYLIYALSTLTHLLFLGWMVLGLIIYFAYSSKHSMCSKEQ
ncbi:amino acid permease [Megasphaera elsdenii CAG:570]|uniref:Amino acid permease n=1 Tax=Megasphaera elsdenii CAG:570 TaxID=1263087 RepID=R7MZE0_MEGEL|nr:amino acid permease [Megasphaera elsdenii CAG:570]